jgi:hypothetical protein
MAANEAELRALMKASLGGDAVAYRTPAVVKQLQADKVAAAYLGDEGGIMCHIVPPENEAAIIVSLTHVRVPARRQSKTPLERRPCVRCARPPPPCVKTALTHGRHILISPRYGSGHAAS